VLFVKICLVVMSTKLVSTAGCGGRSGMLCTTCCNCMDLLYSLGRIMEPHDSNTT